MNKIRCKRYKSGSDARFSFTSSSGLGSWFGSKSGFTSRAWSNFRTGSGSRCLFRSLLAGDYYEKE
jgi:hypothetical protein